MGGICIFVSSTVSSRGSCSLGATGVGSLFLLTCSNNYEAEIKEDKQVAVVTYSLPGNSVGNKEIEIDFLNSFILDNKNSLLGDKISTNKFTVMTQFYYISVHYKNPVFGKVTKEISIQAMVMWRILLHTQRLKIEDDPAATDHH